ncbi:hypothetical protein GCM10010946_09700 [Undibacterium squillarum]|uniref:Uncharacterized protein n=1 Tax=Undibacterium squillarum TaxID=1131567 RepID=A0ABQ2XU54_9BURK|nr:hypothetical protein GCM10010946_09700 [Undibacterium squillarum]
MSFGFFGIFITSYSLNQHQSDPNKASENRSLVTRITVTGLGFLTYCLGYISFPEILAILSVTSVPAHLPLLLKYNKVITIPLILRLVFAPIVLYWSPKFSINQIAIFYFLPLIAYGAFSYVFYYPKLNVKSTLKSSPRTLTATTKLVIQFFTTYLSSKIQADIIFQIINYSKDFATLERVIRSGYSFTFPYIIRKKFFNEKWKKNCSIIFIIIFAIFFSVYKNISPKYMVFLPVIIDMNMSLFIGNNIAIDLIYLLLLLVTNWL